MDLDAYLAKYPNVSRRQLEKFKAVLSKESSFENEVSYLHYSKQKEKRVGRAALASGPLVHVHSISVQSEEDEGKVLALYGKIRVEYADTLYRGLAGHDLYDRDPDDAEILDPTGSLSLNGPSFSCLLHHAFVPLFRSKIYAKLYDGDGNVFADECFSLNDNDLEVGFEQVKEKHISCKRGLLTIKYIAIPFGINCRVDIRFLNKDISNKRDYINVSGKVVARYVNTFGDKSSEECVLFRKPSNAFERVEVDKGMMPLTRYWVAIPAYSTLIFDVDLTEFETGRKIVSDTIELLPRQGLMTGDCFVLDDMFINVGVSWCSGEPQGVISIMSSQSPTSQGSHEEGSDMELDDETFDDDDDDDDDEPSNIPWTLRPHKDKPWPSPAVEIFSVFIDREKSKAISLYGSIEVLCNESKICHIFERSEKDALWLPENKNFLPILGGSRLFEDFSSLEIKVDLKEVGGNLALKGYVPWASATLDTEHYHEKQHCSFIQGDKGFAAVHYSIFADAVASVIKISLNLKPECTDVYSKLHGNIVAQYRYYDYSSRYNQDCFQTVLFTTSQDSPIQLGNDGSVPLSRSSVVVPSYSSLVIKADLSIGDRKLSLSEEFGIDDGCKIVETNDFSFKIEVDWVEIK